jgi:methyl-accepting chemotaxis protein
MSTTPPPPPDRPTQRLQPSPPPAAEYEQRVVEHGVAAPATDPSAMFARLEDAIRSLRTGLIVVGLLSALALGIGLYALLRADETDDETRRGASAERVARLDDRVDRLSRQVQGLRADREGTNELADRVDRLSRSVTSLRGQAAGGDDDAAAAADATQAVEQLGQRVDDLSTQVEELRQNQDQTTQP